MRYLGARIPIVDRSRQPDEEPTMNAATLTALREECHTGTTGGDRTFVIRCRIGRYGAATLAAVDIATRELPGQDAAYLADRVVELVDLTDCSREIDPDTLAAEAVAALDALRGNAAA
jgi:hypothetical protein